MKTHETTGYGTGGNHLYVAGYMDQAFPKTVPVPTMWSQEEMKLLGGTSLEVCLSLGILSRRAYPESFSTECLC